MYLIMWTSLSLVGIGAYFIFTRNLQFASYKAKRLVTVLYGKEKKSYKLDTLLDDLANNLATKIRINEYKRKKLLTQLKIAKIYVSPEKHIATVYIKAALPVVLGLVVSLVLPIAFPISLIIAVIIYFKESNIVDKELLKEKQKIENELPRFVREIAEQIKTSRDVYAILSRYEKTAGESMARELKITLADMKSGNYETALTRFESRVQSPMLSEVVRGLISIIRGDDAGVFFQLLAHDFKILEKERLKTIANKRPDKLKKYTFYMLACMIFLYIVIIAAATIEALGGLL